MSLRAGVPHTGVRMDCASPQEGVRSLRGFLRLAPFDECPWARPRGKGWNGGAADPIRGLLPEDRRASHGDSTGLRSDSVA
jgi:hypothetical protein